MESPKDTKPPVPVFPDFKQQYVPKHPLNMEKKYSLILSAYVDAFFTIAKRDILTGIGGLRLDTARLDDKTTDFMKSLGLKSTVLAPRFKTLVDKVAEDTSAHNKAEWQKTIKSVYGTNVVQHEPWERKLLDVWASNNVTLITSIQEQSLLSLQQAVVQTVMTGSSTKTLAKKIEATYGTTKKRARFIAEDQISKLQGALTQHRQTSFGIDRYRWETAMDDKVRPSHRSKQGRVFRWDDPPADTGHPGFDYHCRCIAIAMFPEGWEE
jgi:SPP1 gp7 family putative phage head morphogenesis protein